MKMKITTGLLLVLVTTPKLSLQITPLLAESVLKKSKRLLS
jgi:hypothetical protein